MRWLVTLLCLCTIGIAILAGPASGVNVARADELDASPTGEIGVHYTDDSVTSIDGASASNQPPITADYTFERLPDHPGEIRVTATFDPPDSVVRLSATVDAGDTVVESEGFSRKSGSSTWIWTGTPSKASLVYRTSVNHSIGGELKSVDTGEWALFAAPRVLPHVRWLSPTHAPTISTNYEVAGDGYATGTHVYLGPGVVETNRTDAGRVTLVVPDAATMQSSDAVFERLQETMSTVHVSTRNDGLVAFVAPDPIRGHTVVGTKSLWVHENEPIGSMTSAWARASVYDRQRYRVTPEMLWVNGGTAYYYAALAALREDRTSYGSFRKRITTDRFAARNLTDPATWPSGRVSSTKGMRAVALIDARIKNVTDGEESFQDVVFAMNRHDGPVSYADFTDFVAEAAGRRLDEFVARVLTGGSEPSLRDDPWIYAGVSYEDHDADGLSNEAERAAGTNPFVADTDYDAVPDGRELDLGTDPTAADTDGDDLLDGRELDLGTDPTAADTDGDGRDDAAEIEAGTDPTSPNTPTPTPTPTSTPTSTPTATATTGPTPLKSVLAVLAIAGALFAAVQRRS
ncbi:MAG: hypothetical protein ABEI96_01450 [Haloarculaceae archaeon]